MVTTQLPALLAAAAPNGDGHSIGALFGALVAIFVATRLFGELAQRVGQPAVLGELLAGVLLGGSVLGIVNPADPAIAAMAEIGVIVLLFETGLHTELRALISVGSAAGAVGAAGVLLPFLAGYGIAIALGVPQIGALVAGAALCATSIGISARVLSELGRLDTREGRVVLGAAVLDDVVGLIILSVVATLVGGAAVTAGGVARTTGIAIGFVVLAVLVGMRLAPVTFKFAERGLRAGGALGVLALAYAFGMAWVADAVGSAMIVGAFAAGIVIYGIPQRHAIEKSTTSIGHFFVPIFFASVGAAVDLGALASPRALSVGGGLIVVGIAGKVIAGFVPWWFTGNKLLVGIAMVPRGEVGLIFAQMGLATGALDAELFGAVMLMVLVTTFVTPPALGWVARRSPAPVPDGLEPETDRPGEGGVDDLVAGTSSQPERRRTPRGTQEMPRRNP